MDMPSPLTIIDNAVAKVEKWVLGILTGMLVLFTFAQVCLRALYTHGHIQWANTMMGHMDWSQPLARLLVLWIAFIGASLVTRDRKHIRIDFLTTVLPLTWSPFREWILAVVSTLICAIMLKVSWNYIQLEMTFSKPLFLQVPAWIGQSILPAGFALFCLRFALRTLEQSLMIVRGLRR
jgi:TRAP-type C4-dicarboxylate transport system permease small subunit